MQQPGAHVVTAGTPRTSTLFPVWTDGQHRDSHGKGAFTVPKSSATIPNPQILTGCPLPVSRAVNAAAPLDLLWGQREQGPEPQIWLQPPARAAFPPFCPAWGPLQFPMVPALYSSRSAPCSLPAGPCVRSSAAVGKVERGDPWPSITAPR